MDTTDVNSGEKNGLKCHLEHTVPMLQWIGCNKHKLASCFKHLILQFPSIFKTDVLLLKLLSSLSISTCKKLPMYGQDPITVVCPRETH